MEPIDLVRAILSPSYFAVALHELTKKELMNPTLNQCAAQSPAHGVTLDLHTNDVPVLMAHQVEQNCVFRDVDGDICLRTHAGMVMLASGTHYDYERWSAFSRLAVDKVFGPLKVNVNGKPADEDSDF